MITIIDYGSGNINAISNIYDILKIPYFIASTPKQLEDSEKIILPGVGSFDHCMQKLNDSGLKEILNRRLGHPEWGMPSLIVVDGGIAQKNAGL